MGRKDNLMAGIMSFLIIMIILLTTYFCLDIFGIIAVPDEISLVKLLGSKTKETVAVKPIEDLIITEDNIDEWINQSQEDNNTQIPEIEENTEIPERILPEENEVQNPVVENKNKNAIMNRLYYYQLDMYGKMIYDRLYDNVENLKTGTYEIDFDTLFNDLLHEENGSEVLENAFQFGINSLLFDHPEIFYLDITKIYMSTEVTKFGPLKTYRIKIGPDGGESYLAESFNNKNSVDVVTEMLETVKSNLRGNIIEKTEYNKIRATHDYLIKTIEYDQTLEKGNIYNIYGALIGKEAVCEGYSKAFKYIMDDFGIPCIIACGIGQNSNGKTESHAWNYVKLNGNWYAVDVTWDDPVIIGTGYVSSGIYEKYFLKGSTDFFKDHTEDGRIIEGTSFVYPTLSINNY